LPVVANITSPITAIPSHITPVGPKVPRITGDLFAILTQFLFRCAIFLVVAEIAHIGSPLALVFINVPAVVANVTGVGPDVSTVPTKVPALRSHCPGNSA
jgi:hypothetical protein